MNLKELFEMQKKLDAHIVKEKELECQDLLPKKILSLQVELGELANEWRGFKFWSKDQEPRTNLKCKSCNGVGYKEHYSGSYESSSIEVHIDICENCGGEGGIEEINPLLEEYVDCLHFILSIGNDLYEGEEELLEDLGEVLFKVNKRKDITEQFRAMFYYTGYLLSGYYDKMLFVFVGLGEMLGITWEQIVQAYKAKNKINHLRQDNGY